MHRLRVALGLLCVLLLGCAAPTVTTVPTPSPSGTATATPTATATATLLIECLDATYPPPPRSPPPGYVGGNFCTMALPVVLAAVAGHGGDPTTVVFDMGAYCPTPGSLRLDTTCPGGAFPPSPGGQSLGHALVSFGGTGEQAYLNLWAYPISRTTVTAELIGITVPVFAPSPSPS